MKIRYELKQSAETNVSADANGDGVCPMVQQVQNGEKPELQPYSL
jgi:hypothetical protein